jgi:hypothetical protein
VAWGSNEHSQTDVPHSFSGVIAIAAGAWHNLALKSDGTVVSWGRNYSGETVVPGGLKGVIAIAAGTSHSAAIVANESSPRMQAYRSGGSLVVKWPLSAEGYVLESSNTLESMVWETVTNAPAVTHNGYVLTNSLGEPSRFFRLRASP